MALVTFPNLHRLNMLIKDLRERLEKAYNKVRGEKGQEQARQKDFYDKTVHGTPLEVGDPSFSTHLYFPGVMPESCTAPGPDHFEWFVACSTPLTEFNTSCHIVYEIWDVFLLGGEQCNISYFAVLFNCLCDNIILFVVCSHSVLYATTHVTSCCIPHPFVIAPTYVCCIGVCVLCHSSMSHLSLPLRVLGLPSTPLCYSPPFTSVSPVCLTLLPPPLLTTCVLPVSFHLCMYSLTVTHSFRSQLYISHNTCTQVENKTASLSVTSFGALTCTGPRTT